MVSWFTCRRTKAREIKCLAKFTWLLVAKLGLTLSRVLFTALHKLPINTTPARLADENDALVGAGERQAASHCAGKARRSQ